MLIKLTVRMWQKCINTEIEKVTIPRIGMLFVFIKILMILVNCYFDQLQTKLTKMRLMNNVTDSQLKPNSHLQQQPFLCMQLQIPFLRARDLRWPSTSPSSLTPTPWKAHSHGWLTPTTHPQRPTSTAPKQHLLCPQSVKFTVARIRSLRRSLPRPQS